jgi:hypothetical protein
LPLRKRRHFVARAPDAEAVRDFIENIRAPRAGGEAVPLRGGWEVLIVDQSDRGLADIVIGP